MRREFREGNPPRSTSASREIQQLGGVSKSTDSTTLRTCFTWEPLSPAWRWRWSQLTNTCQRFSRATAGAPKGVARPGSARHGGEVGEGVLLGRAQSYLDGDELGRRGLDSMSTCGHLKARAVARCALRARTAEASGLDAHLCNLRERHGGRAQTVGTWNAAGETR